MTRRHQKIPRRFFIITSTVVLLYSALILTAISHRTLNRQVVKHEQQQQQSIQYHFPTIDCSLSSAKYFAGHIGWSNYTTALSSYPRSGNTWLRTLIEKSTGYLTSSIYCDHKLRQTFRAECNKTNRFLLKTHYPVNGVRHFPDPQSHWRKFGRLIHLIRNPFDAIVSYHHFRTIAGRTESISTVRRLRRKLMRQWQSGNLSREQYETELRSVSLTHDRQAVENEGGVVEVEGKRHTVKMDRTEFQSTLSNVYWYIAKYRAHYSYWKSVPIERLMLRYEDLKMDPVMQLHRINQFLLQAPGLPQTSGGSAVVDESRIRCAVDDERLPYYSSTRNNDLLYGLEMLGLQSTLTIIRELGPIICELGYGDLLNDRRHTIDGHMISINCSAYETQVNLNDIYIA